MSYYKKALLLILFCLAQLTAHAAKQDNFADTLVKITAVATSQIYPKPFVIEIASKNGKVKISYTHSTAGTYSMETDTLPLKTLIADLVAPDFKEKTETGLSTSSVLDGRVFNFEIITPAWAKHIKVYEPQPDNYPVLHKLVKISMGLYEEKHNAKEHR